MLTPPNLMTYQSLLDIQDRKIRRQVSFIIDCLKSLKDLHITNGLQPFEKIQFRKGMMKFTLDHRKNRNRYIRTMGQLSAWQGCVCSDEVEDSILGFPFLQASSLRLSFSPVSQVLISKINIRLISWSNTSQLLILYVIALQEAAAKAHHRF